MNTWLIFFLHHPQTSNLHSQHGLDSTPSASVYLVHPILSPLAKQLNISAPFTTNTPSPFKKVLMPSRMSSIISRHTTLLPSEPVHQCTFSVERSKLWGSRWSCPVKDQMRSMVDTSTSTLHQTLPHSTRSASRESRTCILQIACVLTSRQWLGVWKQEYPSWIRNSWRSQ